MDPLYTSMWLAPGLIVGAVATLRLCFKIPVRRAMDLLGMAMGVVFYVAAPFIAYTAIAATTSATTPIQAFVPGALAGMMIGYLLSPIAVYIQKREEKG